MQAIVFIFMIGIPFIPACRKAKGTPQKRQPRHEHRHDRFSGITVANWEQAEAMIALRHGNAPLVGETAPDGLLIEAGSEREYFLRELLGKKPVVLIFGSASCSTLDLYLEEIGQLAERFHDRYLFYLIYVREAHPRGGFNPQVLRDGSPLIMPEIDDSPTFKDRSRKALELRGQSGYRLRYFVDTMDDALAVRWGAWPARVFVVGEDHRIIYAGGPGPWYFSITREGWHDPPPARLESAFREYKFTEISLEEFLEG